MIKLIDNANNKIENDFKRKTRYTADVKSVQSAYVHKYNTTFTRSLQALITDIGLIISEVSTTLHIKAATYLGSVDYICLTILNNKELHKTMRDITQINKQGNESKHKLNDINVNMDFCVQQYNYMIYELAKKLNLSVLNKFKIKSNSTSNNNKSKKLDIFGEKASVKYFKTGPFEIEVKLSPNFEFDKFEKKAFVDLTFFWNKVGLTTDILCLDLKNNIDFTTTKHEINLGEKSRRKTIKLVFVESGLKDGTHINYQIFYNLYQQVEKTVKEKKYYTEGILFWKKTQSYFVNVKKYEQKKIDSGNLQIRQTLKKENQ